MASERVPYSDEAWAEAPEGSRLVTDLTTGEQWIEPPLPPVTPDEFLNG